MNVTSLRARKRPVLLAILFAAAIILSLLHQPTACAQTQVGTVTEVTGVAKVERAGSKLDVANQMPILLHDKITTQANSSVTIGMIDNSLLRLDQNGTLTIDDSVMINGVGAPSKVGLFGGKLHALITGAMRGNKPTFEVHTPNAVAAVRGTEFDIDYEEGQGGSATASSH